MTLVNISLNVNGVDHDVSVDENRSLLDVLRNELLLTGSHFGCGQGLCGACMVLLQGRAVHACDTPAWSAANKSIVTVEGLSRHKIGAKVQQEFVLQAAAQCGYCMSGMLISAVAMLVENPSSSETDIRREMDGNLCRCGSHLRVIRAIKNVARDLAAETA